MPKSFDLYIDRRLVPADSVRDWSLNRGPMGHDTFDCVIAEDAKVLGSPGHRRLLGRAITLQEDGKSLWEGGIQNVTVTSSSVELSARGSAFLYDTSRDDLLVQRIISELTGGA